MPSPLVRALLGALLCLLALSPGPAAAHAVLVEARPGDGERLDRPPPELELRFSEPVVGGPVEQGGEADVGAQDGADA